MQTERNQHAEKKSQVGWKLKAHGLTIYRSDTTKARQPVNLLVNQGFLD